MKKIITIITFITAFVIILTACGRTPANPNGETNSETTSQTNASTRTDETEPDNPPTQPMGNNQHVLVVVFSATGTTKAVAERIAAYTGGDFYEIKAAQEYTTADLNWSDRSSRTTIEQNDKSARPAIGSADLNLDGYQTIFIGYPIWWGKEPRILDTFVEKYEFDGITCVPFCTSGGGGVGKSDKNLANNAGSGNWKDGKLLNSLSDSDLQSWIDSVT